MKNNIGKLILDLIEIALSDPNYNGFEDLGALSKNEIESIKKLLNEDLSGYVHVISADQVRHSIIRHGIDSNDRNPILVSDFVLIPIILTDFDTIKKAGTGKKSQNQFIIYEKKIGDIYYCVEEIRKGRKKIAFYSLYKRKSQV